MIFEHRKQDYGSNMICPFWLVDKTEHSLHLSVISLFITSKMIPTIFSSSAPYHLLSYASVTGLTLWHSFIGGPIAFKVLPRQQFGLLQSKLFPIYFSLQSVLNGVCLVTTSNRNARIIFLIGALSGLINLTILGPWTTKYDAINVSLFFSLCFFFM